MNKFPLIRNKISNEHIMAYLFGVLLLYQIPSWIKNPISIIHFIVVLIITLIIDTIFNMMKYNRPVCSVSTAVTVGIVKLFFSDISFWGFFLGAFIAIVLGKLVMGGTGRNMLNPAMLGVFALSIIFPTTNMVFEIHPVIILAFLLSLPLIVVRPYVSLSYLIGIIISLASKDMLTLTNVLSLGIIFWSCVIVTDPTTMTFRPVVGMLEGFSIGLLTILLNSNGSLILPSILVLIGNCISFLYENNVYRFEKKVYKGNRLKSSHYPKKNINLEVINCTNDNKENVPKEGEIFDSKEILKRIETNNVFGMGGGAYPTYKKINTAMNSKSVKKYLIVNAVECDPGLIHDKWLLQNKINEISKGIELLKKCIKFEEIFLATTENGNNLNNAKVKIVSETYPMGEERILIKNVLDINIQRNEIPCKLGILVLNVQTILAIYEAVYYNNKIDSKYITVADLYTNEYKIAKVNLGTKISNIVEKIYNTNKPVYVGGGIMETSRASSDDVVDNKTTLIVMSEHPRYKESPLCSKCGVCVRNCPKGLEVYKIAKLVDSGEFDKLAKYNPEQCISCGVCSYHCFAGNNLTHKMRKAKECIQ